VFVVLPDAINPMTPSEVVANDRRAEMRPAVTPLSRVEALAREEAAPLPGDLDVRLAMIDFGMTARLSTAMRESMVRLLMDISDNRGDDAAATLIELGDPLAEFERQAFSREIAGLVARNYDLAVGEVEAGTVLFEVINASFRNGLRLPAELTLLAKALFNLDAVTRALDPSYSPIRTIREYGDEIAAARARRELNPRRLYQLATEGGDLLTALPHRLDLITQRLANNDFETRIDVPQMAALLRGLQKVANRIFSGLVLAGVLVASAMLLPHRRILGTAGFFVAAVIGLYMVITIWLSDRRRQ